MPRLADYFLICGLNVNQGLEPLNFDSTSDISPLKRGYRSKVLGHYPQLVPNNPFDANAIAELCCPKGLRFCTQKKLMNPSFHSFIITKENGSHFHGYVLTFYEKVANLQICYAMQTLQNLNNSESGYFNRIIQDSKQRFNSLRTGGSLPRRFLMQTDVIDNDEIYNSQFDCLFVTKCIALICEFPFHHAARHFLFGLLKHFKNSTRVHIENFIASILFDIVPPSSGFSISVSWFGKKVIIQLPSENEFPLCEYSMKKMFSLLETDTIVQLFSCMLLECHILLFSEDLEKLILISECMTALLYPFTWQHVYVPIVPITLLHILDAPLPYIMGICMNQLLPEMLKKANEANLCICNIDKQIFNYPVDLPHFPSSNVLIQELSSMLSTYGIFDKNQSSVQKLRWNSDWELNYRESDISSNSNGVMDSNDYIEEQKQNYLIRGIFLRNLAHKFSFYDKCILLNQKILFEEEHSILYRFDKTSFLCHCPQKDRSFFSRFLETQMFTSFIDNKIVSLSDEKKSCLKYSLFDHQIQKLRNVLDSNQPLFENKTDIEKLLEPLKQRLHNSCEITSMIYSEALQKVSLHDFSKSFPILNSSLFEKKNCIQFQNSSLNDNGNTGGNLDYKTTKQKHNFTPNVMQINCHFVEQLLKEFKIKIKRLLMYKLDSECLESDLEDSILGIEENTLITGLCDLLECIWSHGKLKKKSCSSLWLHLLAYQDKEESSSPFTANSEAPVPKNKGVKAESLEKNNVGEKKYIPEDYENGLKPLPEAISYDMRSVEAMDELRYSLSYTRAWIKLSLERGLLAKHLHKLLSDKKLLECEEEQDQLLHHLTSLNTVPFLCFTNSYVNTEILYQVVIVFSKNMSGLKSSAIMWIRVFGTLRETNQITITKGATKLFFQYKNLGMLTALRIGHDNTGINPNCLLDSVSIRNELTGYTYKFFCGRWLGRSIDDGSTERLLIGTLVCPLNSCKTVSISNTCLYSAENDTSICDIQSKRTQKSIIPLLYGPNGLIAVLEKALLFGYRSSRIFTKNLFLWDFLYDLQGYYLRKLHERRKNGLLYESTHQQMREFCLLIEKINKASQTLGKDDKFQLFICLSLITHKLDEFIQLMAKCPITVNMYEEFSFLRNSNLLNFIITVSEAIKEFDIPIESSIDYGLLS